MSPSNNNDFLFRSLLLTMDDDVVVKAAAAPSQELADPTHENDPEDHSLKIHGKKRGIVLTQFTPSDEENKDAPCQYCQSVPCLLEDGLYDFIVEQEQYIRECDTSEEKTNKEIRYQLYKEATRWMHGHLGKGVRKKIPQCVETEIRDLAPEPGRDYIGFQEANKD
jgi:hypothetical protein